MVNRIATTLLLMLALIPGAFAQSNSLSAFVDRTDISINDVITLTIRIDASLGNARPSLAGLNREFEQVGGVSTRSTYTNNNGNIQSWTEYSIMLRPLMTGVLTIPSFRINGEVSVPIRINVGDAPAVSNNGNEEIFLQTTVSKEQVYVQEQLLYTIKIYYSISFDQGAQLTSPQVADAVVQQLGNDDNYQEVVNGIGYNVTERRFVIFPQSSGDFTIPPVYFQASVGRRSGINRFFNNRTQVREINLTSETHQIDVLPRPANFPGQTWLPASTLTLEESWSGELDNITVGDAVTRNIVMTATGLSSSLLPGVQFEDLPGLRFYPDQPVREDSADRNGVVGKRSEGTAIVASQAGTFTMPEVRLPWWNTETNTLQTAVLPARTITVLPAAGLTGGSAADFGTFPLPADGRSNPQQSQASQTSGLYLFWISATVFFAAAWLISTTLWLKSRRQLAYAETMGPASMPLRMPQQARTGTAMHESNTVGSADAALRVLKTACENSNLADIRKAVLKWGQASFNDSSLLTLEELARRCRDDQVAAGLNQLDAALYGSHAGEFSGKTLYAAVADLHKRGIAQDTGTDKYGLPPLYRIH
jgi:hypothetical protein